MPTQDAGGLARLQVPDAHGAVERSRSDKTSIIAHIDRIDPVRVALENRRALAGLQVPNADGSILGSRNRQFAVRRSTYIADSVRVPVQRPKAPADSRSHTRTVLSHEPERTRLPSGVTYTDVTAPSCPFRLASCWPVVRSHTCTDLSPEFETARRPSAVVLTLMLDQRIRFDSSTTRNSRQAGRTNRSGRFVHSTKSAGASCGCNSAARDTGLSFGSLRACW